MNESEQSAVATENPNQDLLSQQIVVGRFTIPPISLNTAILLEQVDSPFMRRAVDPLTGDRMVVIPTMMELAETLYVMLNQNNPQIQEIIRDQGMFSRMVQNMAQGISFVEMKAISDAISAAIKATNQASTESGLEASPKKDGTGPSPS